MCIRDRICIGSTRTLTPGLSYTQYLWSDGSIGSSLPVTAIGKYWVSVMDIHGCKGSDTAKITAMAPLPKDFLPLDTSICQYGKLTLASTQSYKDYLWNDSY